MRAFFMPGIETLRLFYLNESVETRLRVDQCTQT